MKRGGPAGPIAAAIAAAISFLFFLKMKTGSGSDASMAFIVFSLFSLGAMVIGLIAGLLLRKLLNLLSGALVGIVSGALSVVLLFGVMQGISSASSERFRQERLAEGETNLSKALERGFPDLGLPVSDSNYQIDAGPSVIMLSTESSDSICDRLTSELPDWTVAKFESGCWIGRNTTQGYDQIRVTEGEAGTGVKYIVGGAFRKLGYETAVKFCESIQKQQFEEAAQLVQPEFLAKIGGPAGLQKWVESKELEMGEINLYPNMERYAQPLKDGRYWALYIGGGLPRIERFSIESSQY